MLWILLSLSMVQPQLTFDFGRSDTNDWRPLVDGVMGGRSTGSIEHGKNTMTFSGKLSLENNGGFSSVRSPWEEVDMTVYQEAAIRIKGDGRTYVFCLENASFPTPYYTWEIKTVVGEWIEITKPLRDFEQKMVGRKTGRTINEDQLATVRRVGLMLSDKNPGDFAVEIDYIRFR